MSQRSILHVSDLHFGPPYVPEVGQALLEMAPDLGVDAIIISGDLTQRARREQFAQARSFLDKLPDVPRLVIPGNHDVPLYRVSERMRDPHRLYREYICEELNPVLHLEGVTIVGLDSTAPRSAISNGRIHLWQLDYCARAFSEAPADAARIVVAHHHFAPAPDYIHDQTMPKAKRAVARFLELGVEMILGGHLHRAYIGNSLDFFPDRNRERGIIIVQSGTSTSRRGRGRERERNSFNVIHVGGETFEIVHFLYYEHERRFLPLSRHLFPRPKRRFLPWDEALRRTARPLPAAQDAAAG